MQRALVIAWLVVAGCGSGGNSQMMPPVPDMARGATDHPPLWQITGHGGAPQAAPEVYTVVWPGSEAIGKQVADFVDWMLKSDYWTGSLQEYGVGAGKSMGLIVLPTPPPASISDDELVALARTLASSNQVTLTANTQLAFLPPPTTPVTSVRMGNGCDVYAGYHGQTKVDTTTVAYSINLQCAGEAGEPIDQLTRVISHETGEAATDTTPGNGFIDSSPGFQEIGDLCNFGAGLPVDVPADAQHPARRYWLQRQYSGKTAMAGNLDPCIPLPWKRPYWNVALDPPVLHTPVAAQQVTLTARLDVFAYGDVGVIKWFASPSDSATTVTPNHGEAQAGDTIPITVTTTPSQAKTIEIDIDSESEKAGAAAWFSYVTVP